VKERAIYTPIEKFSGIALSKTITIKEVPESITSQKVFVPLESLDLVCPIEEEYFTVGVVVEV
jgi:hypothetical protein